MKTDSNQHPDKSRILLFSHKNIYAPAVWRCPFREFERIVQEVDSVDVVAPIPKSSYRYGISAAMRLGEFVDVPMNPGLPTTRVNREYDMFITVCERPGELIHLKSLEGFRDKCKTTVCWLPEFYVKDIPQYKSSIGILKEFDYVFFMFVVNEPFKKIIKGKGQYLPAGVDALSFCPYPSPPVRSIDVLSIGRRAPAIHQGLLRMAAEDGKFYMYDTINSLTAYNLEEHRLMTANMAKRSRYFIVSPGKFNRPEETGGQSEFGYRYFEAAAPGTIMIGMRPYNNKEFDKIFDWEDSVIEVPFESDGIVSVIRELDKQPERQLKMRQRNMTECLLKHDWVYRWESILNMVGLQPQPALENRKRVLRQLTGALGENFAQQMSSHVS
jgi:hypothetical protein